MKNRTQQNVSYLHVQSLDHLGAELSAVRAGIQIFNHGNGNLHLQPMLKYLMNLHIED